MVADPHARGRVPSRALAWSTAGARSRAIRRRPRIAIVHGGQRLSADSGRPAARGRSSPPTARSRDRADSGAAACPPGPTAAPARGPSPIGPGIGRSRPLHPIGRSRPLAQASTGGQSRPWAGSGSRGGTVSERSRRFRRGGAGVIGSRARAALPSPPASSAEPWADRGLGPLGCRSPKGGDPRGLPRPQPPAGSPSPRAAALDGERSSRHSGATPTSAARSRSAGHPAHRAAQGVRVGREDAVGKARLRRDEDGALVAHLEKAALAVVGAQA